MWLGTRRHYWVKWIKKYFLGEVRLSLTGKSVQKIILFTLLNSIQWWVLHELALDVFRFNFCDDTGQYIHVCLLHAPFLIIYHIIYLVCKSWNVWQFRLIELLWNICYCICPHKSFENTLITYSCIIVLFVYFSMTTQKFKVSCIKAIKLTKTSK